MQIWSSKKIRIIPRIAIALGCTLLLCIPNTLANSLQVGVLNTGSQQKSAFLRHVREFEAANSNISVTVNFYSDAEFKVALAEWLASGRGPDIITWQGGNRLFQYVDNRQAKDLTALWNKHGWKQTFSEGSQGAVFRDGSYYGIPLSYYQWGLYYRASVFESLGIQAPQNWDEFLSVCARLNQADIVPLTIGAKNKWPSAAWFDYLNLRVNGLEFHQSLLAGEHAFTDQRVVAVMEKWKALLDANCFTNKFNGWAWQQAMPYLYHKLGGMTLIGNFFAGSLPERLKEDFRFTPFPIIDSSVPRFEEAPLDILMVPAYAKISSSLETFLVSLADVQFQQSYNDASSMISPNVNVPPSKNYFIQEGQKLLSSAQGVSQFFDRDTNAEMAGAATVIFTEFLEHHDVNKAVDALEKARQSHLLN